MALLRFKNASPPYGGFTYLQKETNLLLSGNSLGECVDSVIAHRKHKGLEPTDRETVQLEIERWICGKLGESECMPEGQGDAWVPTPIDSNALSLDKIMGFSRAAWSWFKGGGDFVSVEESRRRAQICFHCPANISPGHDCFKCTLTQMIQAAVPEERRIAGLHSCQFCGCDLVSKVNLPDAGIFASDFGRNIQFPQWCWQKEILAKKAILRQ